MGKKIKFIFAFVLLVLFPVSKASGRDFGIFGDGYPVSEKNLSEVLKNRVKTAVASGEFQKKTEEYSRQLQANFYKDITRIKPALKTVERSYDPSTIIKQEIKHPDGLLYYPAGTRVNPLDYMDFTEILIFIDGRDKASRDFANSYQDQHKNSKIILFAGTPGEITDEKGVKRYYYFDTGAQYTKKFNITFAPAVVFQKTGAKVLTIGEFFLGSQNDKN